MGSSLAEQLGSRGNGETLSVLEYRFKGSVGRHVISTSDEGKVYDFMFKKEFSSIEKLLKYIGADLKNYQKTDVDADSFMRSGGRYQSSPSAPEDYNQLRWEGNYGELLLKNLKLPSTLNQPTIDEINTTLAPAGMKLTVGEGMASISRISDGTTIAFYTNVKSVTLNGEFVSVGTGNYALNPVDPMVTEYPFAQKLSSGGLAGILENFVSSGFTPEFSQDKKTLFIKNGQGTVVATYGEETDYELKRAYETNSLGWEYAGAPGAQQSDLVQIAQALLGKNTSGKLDSETFAAYLSYSVTNGKDANALPIPKETGFLADWGYGGQDRAKTQSDFFTSSEWGTKALMEKITIEERAKVFDPSAPGAKIIDNVLSGYSEAPITSFQKAELDGNISWLKGKLAAGDPAVADSLAEYIAALGNGKEGALTLNEIIKEIKGETQPITAATLNKYIHYQNGEAKPGNERKVVGEKGEPKPTVSDAIKISRDFLSKPVAERERKGKIVLPAEVEDESAEYVAEPGLSVSYKPPAKITLPSEKKMDYEATYVILDAISDQRKTFDSAYNALAKEFTKLKPGDFLAGEKFFGAIHALAGTRTNYQKMSDLYVLMIRQKGELMLAYDRLTWYAGATADQKKAAAGAMTPAVIELRMAELGRCQERLLGTMNKLKGYLVNYGPTLSNLVDRCFDTLLLASLPFAVSGLANFGVSLASKQVAFNLTWKAVGVKLARSAVFAAGTTGVSVFSEIKCKKAMDSFMANQKGAVQDLQKNLTALYKRMQNEYRGENKQQVLSSIEGMISSLEAAKAKIQSVNGPSLGSVAIEFLSSTAMFFTIEMLMADYVKVGSKKGKTLFTNSSSKEVSLLRNGEVVGTVKPKGVFEVQSGDVVQLSAGKTYKIETVKNKPRLARVKEQPKPPVAETPITPIVNTETADSAPIRTQETPVPKDPVQTAKENKANVEAKLAEMDEAISSVQQKSNEVALLERENATLRRKIEARRNSIKKPGVNKKKAEADIAFYEKKMRENNMKIEKLTNEAVNTNTNPQMREDLEFVSKEYTRLLKELEAINKRIETNGEVEGLITTRDEIISFLNKVGKGTIKEVQTENGRMVGVNTKEGQALINQMKTELAQVKQQIKSKLNAEGKPYSDAVTNADIAAERRALIERQAKATNDAGALNDIHNEAFGSGSKAEPPREEITPIENTGTAHTQSELTLPVTGDAPPIRSFEPQRLQGIGQLEFIEGVPTFTDTQNYARIYGRGGASKPLDVNGQCALLQGDMVLNYNNTQAFRFNGTKFEPIGKGDVVPLEVHWKYLNNRATRLLRKQATAVKMEDGGWLVVNTSKKDMILTNNGVTVTLGPGQSRKVPSGAEIRFGAKEGPANYKISPEGAIIQVGASINAPKPPGFIKRKGKAIVRTYKKVKDTVVDTAVAAKKLRRAKAPKPDEARPSWFKRQVEKKTRPFKKAYEKVREVSSLIAEFKNAKKIISESKVSGIYELADKYQGGMSYYPSHGVLQSSGSMPVAGVKLHIMLPSASEPEHYAMADYLMSQLLALGGKFSPGKFGFKYMKGSSTYRMQGSQFGKDFTLYFNDLQSFEQAKPILAQLDMVLRSIGPNNGKAGVLSKNTGLAGGRLNIDSELPLEGTGFMTYSVRHHSGGTLAVPTQELSAISNSAGISEGSLGGMQKHVHAGTEYFLLSDDFLRAQSTPELNLALENAYRRGILKYFSGDRMVDMQ